MSPMATSHARFYHLMMKSGYSAWRVVATTVRAVAKMITLTIRTR
jgi:hypothetical protein